MYNSAFNSKPFQHQSSAVLQNRGFSSTTRVQQPYVNAAQKQDTIQKTSYPNALHQQFESSKNIAVNKIQYKNESSVNEDIKMIYSDFSQQGKTTEVNLRKQAMLKHEQMKRDQFASQTNFNLCHEQKAKFSPMSKNSPKKPNISPHHDQNKQQKIQSGVQKPAMFFQSPDQRQAINEQNINLVKQKQDTNNQIIEQIQKALESLKNPGQLQGQMQIQEQQESTTLIIQIPKSQLQQLQQLQLQQDNKKIENHSSINFYSSGNNNNTYNNNDNKNDRKQFDLKSIKQQQEKIKSQISTIQQKIDKSPKVEGQQTIKQFQSSNNIHQSNLSISHMQLQKQKEIMVDDKQQISKKIEQIKKQYTQQDSPQVKQSASQMSMTLSRLKLEKHHVPQVKQTDNKSLHNNQDLVKTIKKPIPEEDETPLFKKSKEVGYDKVAEKLIDKFAKKSFTDDSIKGAPSCKTTFQNEEEKEKNDNIVKQHYLLMQHSVPQLLNSPIQEFVIGKCLGKGAFSEVYQAVHKRTHMMTAIKILNKNQLAKLKYNNQLIGEIQIQSFLVHPNLLRLWGFFDDEDRIYLITEYADSGDLYSMLQKQPNKKFTEMDTAIYIRQVCDAVYFMHSNHVMHRDIKPENILINSGVLKICDLGSAGYAPKNKRSTFCGTMDYVSPEVINGQSYDKNVDLWSIGILAYELASGSTPFEDPNQTNTMINILQSEVKFPKYFSSELIDFISRLPVKKSSQRMRLEEVLRHPWLENNLKNFKAQWNQSLIQNTANLLR